MREIDRLSALQMRVARNDDVRVPGPELDEGALKVSQFTLEQGDFLA